nr:group II intron maturase-specific domain-containing protein [Bradyrhizobium sp. sGM-13]
MQARLNRLLGGWSAYFSYGSLATAHQAVDRHVFRPRARLSAQTT